MFWHCKCQSRLNFDTRADNTCLCNVLLFLHLSGKLQFLFFYITFLHLSEFLMLHVNLVLYWFNPSQSRMSKKERNWNDITFYMLRLPLFNNTMYVWQASVFNYLCPWWWLPECSHTATGRLDTGAQKGILCGLWTSRSWEERASQGWWNHQEVVRNGPAVLVYLVIVTLPSEKIIYAHIPVILVSIIDTVYQS